MPWIIIEKNGARRKVLPGEPFPGDWDVVDVEEDPGGSDHAQELYIEAARLLEEIEKELKTEGRGPGDWIRFFAKPVALLLGKADCVACDVRGAALNAYKTLREKYGKEEARRRVRSIIRRSFTEQAELLLLELKQAIEG